MEQGPTPERRLAGTVCAQLHRAYRDIRFYPPGHPSVRQSLDSLTDLLASYLEQWGVLLLEVDENRLLHDGEMVYSYEAGPDNLAFLMFRDGIRSLSFLPGLEPAEVEAFATCLAHADDQTDPEHDLVTRLWEQDFAHIDYHVADPFLGGEVLREGEIDALRETVLRRLEELEPEGVPDPAGRPHDLRAVEPTAVDLGSLGLAEAEIDHMERAAQEASNLARDFLTVLLEIVGRAPLAYDPDAPFTQALVAVVGLHADERNLTELELVLEHLQRWEALGRCPAGFPGLVMSHAITAERVGRLLAARGQEPPPHPPGPHQPATRAQKFLRAVLPWTIPAHLEALILAEDRTLRRTLMGLLESAGGLSAGHLAPLLSDSRWYVVRNAVQLAAGLRDPELLPHLHRLSRHPEVRVRREVMRTLDAFGDDPAALRVLALALADTDSAVRTLAVGGLGRHGGKEQEALVLAHIQKPDFVDRPSDEIEAFLTAYAGLAGERAVPLLDRLWRRRLFATRPLPVRMAALKVLATIPGPSAQAALRDATKAGEKPIRKAAEQALYEARQVWRGKPE
jgi:hypothetical protein